MVGAQVRIPLRRRDVRVTQDFRHRVDICSAHYELTRRVMTQIVKAKLLDLRSLQESSPRPLDRIDLENATLTTSLLPPAFQNLERIAVEDHGPLHVGFVGPSALLHDNEMACVEINISPTKLQQLSSAARRIECQAHERLEVVSEPICGDGLQVGMLLAVAGDRALAGFTDLAIPRGQGLEQAGTLIRFQIADDLLARSRVRLEVHEGTRSQVAPLRPHCPREHSMQRGEVPRDSAFADFALAMDGRHTLLGNLLERQ